MNIHTYEHTHMHALFYLLSIAFFTLHRYSAEHLDLVRYFISRGADVNKASDAGATLLILAAHEGNDEMVKLFIDKGAVVDQKDKRGRTSLMLAAFKGYSETAKYLIERGAGVNETNNEGFAPLHFASQVSLAVYATD